MHSKPTITVILYRTKQGLHTRLLNHPNHSRVINYFQIELFKLYGGDSSAVQYFCKWSQTVENSGVGVHQCSCRLHHISEHQVQISTVSLKPDMLQNVQPEILQPCSLAEVINCQQK